MNNVVRAGKKVALVNSNANTIKHALARSIEQLPRKAKLVLSLYYIEKLSLKEIGKVLNTSESEVSQIHSQASSILQARFQDAKRL